MLDLKVKFLQAFLLSDLLPNDDVLRQSGVSDHAFHPSLDLRQHGSNGVVARIGGQDVRVFIRRH